jgi:Arc/MetJ family transcription regulator
MKVRTTLELDGELLRDAEALAPEVRTKTQLVETALRTLIELRASRAVAEMYVPDYQPPPKRKPR